jgi:3-isopropylmalate/(R)-2-methylmalate dehydratase large subunit
MKVRRIRVNGRLPKGVYAKDVILTIIQRLGVSGGNGYAYEYAGDTIERMSMDERMTICNMSIEGGARVGYVNPDDTTFAYLEGRAFAPRGEAFERAKVWWRSMASDPDAVYDDDVEINAETLTPVVTWGVNPGQSIGIDEMVPNAVGATEQSTSDALTYMGLRPGQPIAGLKVDVAFIGSCTNGRLSDLREAARIVRGHHVAAHVKALVVPGSVAVQKAAEREGLDQTFRDAGFDWRDAGCSMCLGMNPDKLEGNQVCAASSNRNFKGRQGSPTGRTLLMSPAMVAAAALAGQVTDVRELVDEMPVGVR